MTESSHWNRYRSWLCDLPELGFRLDVSRMDIPDGWVDSMSDRLAASLTSMKELEAGALANPDEQRRVGHYWLRTPALAPSAEIRRQIEETTDRIVEFAEEVHSGKIRPPTAGRFEQLLVIGIGGSALGPQFVADALGSDTDRLAPHFLDNTDPDGIDRVLGRLKNRLDRTLTVVISKSGGTAETRNGMLEATAAYRARGLEIGPHAVAITQDGSRLDEHAVEHGFLARFPMWDWVGGRTSETSVVGLLPAALQGIDVRGLLRGASEMDAATRATDSRRNPAALLALAWYHAGDGRGAKDMVILPYKDRLSLISRYMQQLVMESLGKERDLDGYVQQLRDGISNFFVTFIEVLREREGESIEVDDGITAGDFLQGFLLGTRRALHENGRPSMTVTLREVDPAGVGMLIALFERAVGLYAGLVHVNAYHQPGVEAGKKAAASVIELQRRLLPALRDAGDAGATCEALARTLDAEAEVETLFMLLERFAANPVRGIVRSAGATPFDAIYRLSTD